MKQESILSKFYGEMRPFYCNTKNISTPERCDSDAPFKKRKLFENSSSTVYDSEASGESISNSPDMVFKGSLNDSATVPHRVTKISSSVKGHPAFFPSKDSRVKLSIKSFWVPELYIEVPETATVGSLKRMVLKSVSYVLGGGLCVGVLLQGKKVRDDDRTLLQTGLQLVPFWSQVSQIPLLIFLQLIMWTITLRVLVKYFPPIMTFKRLKQHLIPKLWFPIQN